MRHRDRRPVDDPPKFLPRAESSGKVHHLGVRAESVGATATGAKATGAQAIWALAVGAIAIGALAIGALAIGRLAIKSARIRRIEVDDLVVRRLRITEELHVPREAKQKNARAPRKVARRPAVAKQRKKRSESDDEV